MCDHEQEETLSHLTKNRVHAPQRRKPSRFEHSNADGLEVSTVASALEADCNGGDSAGGSNGGDAKQKFSPDGDNPVMV